MRGERREAREKERQIHRIIRNNDMLGNDTASEMVRKRERRKRA